MLSVWGCHSGNGENERMLRENISKQKTKEWGAGKEMREIPIDRRTDTNNAFTLMPIIWTGRKIKTFA